MRTRKKAAAVIAATALTGASLVGLAGPALASSTATANVTGGTLAFVSTPGNPSLAALTLDGANQTITGALPIDVGDSTGTGAGWNITMTSTQFSTGGTTPYTLPTSATTVNAAPSVACDANATGCTLATNPSGTGSVSYPYTLPASSTAPTATAVFAAATNSGMGDQTVTPTFTVAIPANAYAGTYTSTWTISLVSGP